MRSFVTAFIAIFLILLALMITCPSEVRAYVDPGTTGMLSQILYVLFYGALGLFFYFLRYIRQYLINVKEFLKRLAGRGT